MPFFNRVAQSFKVIVFSKKSLFCFSSIIFVFYFQLCKFYFVHKSLLTELSFWNLLITGGFIPTCLWELPGVLSHLPLWVVSSSCSPAAPSNQHLVLMRQPDTFNLKSKG